MPTNFAFDDEIATELCERARTLQPLLLAEAMAAEGHGRLSRKIVALLSEAGLFRIAAPRRVRGMCASATTMANVAAILAQSCPSTAWLVVVSNSNSWLASLAPADVLADVFANGVPIVSGAANPTGSSKKVDGGYLVTGRWPYSSCCYHADWSILTLGTPGPSGRPIPVASAYVPSAQVTIDDTWQVAGLKATGSSTVVANELFVPEHCYVTNERGNEALALHKSDGEASDFLPMVPHVRTTLLGVLIGAAEAILELVVSGAKSRGIAFTTHERQSESSVAQREIGEAAAMIGAARLMMAETARAVDQAAVERRAMDRQEQSRNRALSCHAVETLVKAANKLMYAGGSSAFADKNPIQRYWRDLNVAARHALNIPSVGYEIYGQSLLNISPTVATTESSI